MSDVSYNPVALRPLVALVGWLTILTYGPVLAADLVISNARVFTAVDASVIESANVVITGERIESVTTAPVDTTGATVIDASGKMLLPGLIDAHLHAFFRLPSLDGTITDVTFPTTDAQARANISGPMRERFEAYLDQGFTSLLSVIDFWPAILEAREQVAAGEIRGPRLFAAGGVFIAPGGHPICSGDTWCNEHLVAEIANAQEARDWVGRYADSGVDLIVHDNLSNPPGLSLDLISEIVQTAHDRDLRVFLTASNAVDIGDLVAAGIDGFLHPPDGTADIDGSLLASAGAGRLPVALTIGRLEEMYRLGTLSLEARQIYRIRRQNILTLLEQGAVPVFGTDLGDKPGTTPRDIIRIQTRAMTGLGLSREQVLQAATRNAAQAMLGRDDLGTLEAGNLADMIVVDGDPLIDLDTLANVEVVIKGGAIVVDKRD